MKKSKSSKNSSPAKKTSSRKRGGKRRTRSYVPLLINQVRLPEQVSSDGFPVLQLQQRGDFYYATSVEGTASGAPVRRVAAKLLRPNQTIPAKPPADSVFVRIKSPSREGFVTDYDFSGKNGLGPVAPGDLVRLVTWVEFAVGELAEPTFVMATNLATFLAAPCNASCEITETTKPTINGANLKFKVTANGGAKIKTVWGLVHRTKGDANDAIKNNVMGTQTNGGPANPLAGEATGWSPSGENWLVTFARYENCIKPIVSQDSPKQIT